MSRWPVGSDGLELKPFLAHLEDLRRLLIRCAAVIAVAMGVAIPLIPRILDLLRRPLAGSVPDTDAFLRSIDVAGAFTATMRIAMWSGMVAAAPILVLLIARYLAPALKETERRAMNGIGGAGLVLFAAGVWLGYRFTLPFAIRAMLGLHDWLGIRAEWTLTSYVTFATQILVAFGLAFELPVVLLLLGRVGLLSSATLRTYRRHAILGTLVLGAILTPPDVFSQMMLSIPLILLYEVCVWVIWAWERPARNRAAGTAVSG